MVKATRALTPLSLFAAIPTMAYAQFTGPYDHSLWSFTANGGDGKAVATPTSLELTGNDAGGLNIATDYTIAAAASGTWAFDWKFFSIDTGPADFGGYLINDTFTVLASSQGGMGIVSTSVKAGDVIGFRVLSADGIFGPGILTITNFSGPIPSPGIVAVLVGSVLVPPSRRNRRTCPIGC